MVSSPEVLKNTLQKMRVCFLCPAKEQACFCFIELHLPSLFTKSRLICLHRMLTDIHMINADHGCTHKALNQPLNIRLPSLYLHLHTAVGKILHPSRQMIVYGRLDSPVSEADSLDAARK